MDVVITGGCVVDEVVPPEHQGRGPEDLGGLGLGIELGLGLGLGLEFGLRLGLGFRVGKGPGPEDVLQG